MKHAIYIFKQCVANSVHFDFSNNFSTIQAPSTEKQVIEDECVSDVLNRLYSANLTSLSANLVRKGRMQICGLRCAKGKCCLSRLIHIDNCCITSQADIGYFNKMPIYSIYKIQL